MKKIMIVVGARPNFMKAAPVVFAIREHNETAGLADQLQCVLVHTGQHYDEAMSGSFFSDLSLPQPDLQLGVGSGSHAVQTAEIMRRFEPVLLEQRPNLVAVVGDVNSTVACALVTAKFRSTRMERGR
jgi:UDP-N-acetylglucosamine 2-epimerase (non-hydrolysing)